MNSHMARQLAGCEQGDNCLRLQGGICGITQSLEWDLAPGICSCYSCFCRGQACPWVHPHYVKQCKRHQTKQSLIKNKILIPQIHIIPWEWCSPPHHGFTNLKFKILKSCFPPVLCGDDTQTSAQPCHSKTPEHTVLTQYLQQASPSSKRLESHQPLDITSD